MEPIIKHIIHLSDIHIRPLERHDEYQTVFDKLYIIIKQIIKNEPTAIVICGDILHEKDRLKAETVTFTRKFLKDLLQITPHLIIFSGNHDLIEYNPDRMDSLWAITQDIPQIIYMRYTCTYQIGDLVFCHNSLIDKKFHDPHQLKTQFPTQTLVGLYHGPLNQVRTYNNFTLESKVTKEQFSHYHLTLLGDIHKFQFITPTMAYCGSLIQQNFGEPLKNHGFIHWIPETNNRTIWTGTHIPIKNKYGFVKVRLVKDKPLLISTPTPKNISMRVYIPYGITKEQVDSDIKSIKNRHNVIYEDLVYDNYQLDTVEIKTDDNIDDIPILEGQLKNNPNIQDIVKIHKEYKDQIPNTNNYEPKYFRIISMAFENTFIYHGNMNIVNFNEMSNIIAIPGPNAIGKSCILKILLFTLFNGSVATNSSIIHKNAKQCKIIINFSTGKINYRVTRIITTYKSSQCILEKENIQAKNWENISAPDVNGTITKISKLLGLSCEDFMINYVFTNTSKSFLDLKDAQMIETLNNHFQLDIYKEIQKKVKEKINNFTNIITKLQAEIDSAKEIIEEKQHKVPKPCDKTSQDLRKELEKVRKEKKKINYAAITFKFKKISEPPIETNEDYQTLYNKYVNIVNGPQYDQSNYQNIVDKLKDATTRIENYNPGVTNCPIDSKIIKEKLDKWAIFKQKLEEERNKLNDFIDNFNDRELEIKEFINKILDGSYDFIPQNIKEITPEIFTEVLRYREDLEQQGKLKQIKEDMEKQQIASSEAMTLQRKLIYLQEESKKTQERLDAQEKDLSELYYQRQNWERQEAYKTNKVIDIQSKQKEINTITDEIQVYKTYYEAINKDKLPFQLLKKKLEKLTICMNDFLNSFANFKIDLSSRITPNTEKLDIIIYKDKLELSPKDLSGYETFILNMGFKYILSRFNKVNKVSLLFIDEGLDCIDSQNFQKLPILFERLSYFYEKIILISHIPEIKDLAKSIIKIERINNTSSRIINE